MDNATLIADVLSARLEQGVSLRHLGRQIGVSFSTLARMERGEGNPSLETRVALLEWLGCDASIERRQLMNQSSASSLLSRVADLEILVDRLLDLKNVDIEGAFLRLLTLDSDATIGGYDRENSMWHVRLRKDYSRSVYGVTLLESLERACVLLETQALEQELFSSIREE